VSAAARALGLALWLVAVAARGEETGSLEPLFVEARALGPGWETLGEAPTDPEKDPEMRAAGVRTVHALHYTRERPGGSEVCSVEIWGFASPAQARSALTGMARAGWRLDVRGNLLVMLRGVALQRDRKLRPGLLPACHRLADLTLERAETALHGAPTPR
jgi:hypothetical protein